MIGAIPDEPATAQGLFEVLAFMEPFLGEKPEALCSANASWKFPTTEIVVWASHMTVYAEFPHERVMVVWWMVTGATNRERFEALLKRRQCTA